MIHTRAPSLRFFLPVILAILGAGICLFVFPAETKRVQQHFISFPDSDTLSHLARPWILAALCFLPALAALCYCWGQTLDRYLVRRFTSILSICISALVLIWLLLDLSDNISDFKQSAHPLRTIGEFYLTRAPAILMLLLPYSLLLASLYSLTLLSTHREIIAMVQAGRGVFRIVMPIILCGLFFTLGALGLNYHWAPLAEGTVEALKKKAVGETADDAKNVLFYNPEERRIWRIGAFPADYEMGKSLRDLDVSFISDQGTLMQRLRAKTASWDRNTGEWTMTGATIGHFAEGRPTTFETFTEPLKMPILGETPWQLIKPGLEAAYLGIPDLTTWLNFNTRNMQADAAPYATQWHHRIALPFGCIITVLLATPLAISFSRQSGGSGIFLAVVLSALSLLLSHFCLSLGEAGTLRPALAAWLPNVFFMALACWLFHYRANGRSLSQMFRKAFSSKS